MTIPRDTWLNGREEIKDKTLYAVPGKYQFKSVIDIEELRNLTISGYSYVASSSIAPGKAAVGSGLVIAASAANLYPSDEQLYFYVEGINEFYPVVRSADKTMGSAEIKLTKEQVSLLYEYMYNDSGILVCLADSGKNLFNGSYQYGNRLLVSDGTETSEEFAGLKVGFNNGKINDKTNAIQLEFYMENNTQKAIKVSDLKFRYYFTDDGAYENVFMPYGNDASRVHNYVPSYMGYAIGDKLSASFTKIVDGTNANQYIELSLNTGDLMLLPGGYLELKGQFTSRDAKGNLWYLNYTQTNDYSFVGNLPNDKKVTIAKNNCFVTDKISVFYQNKLIKGTTTGKEPEITPTPTPPIVNPAPVPTPVSTPIPTPAPSAASDKKRYKTKLQLL